LVKPYEHYEHNCGDLSDNLTLRIPPFKVTKGHLNLHESIGYLSLPINHGHVLYRFSPR